MLKKLLKVATVFVLFVSIYLGVKLNSIQVPRGLENGHLYKTMSFSLSVISSLSRGLAWINVGQEAANLRSIANFLEKQKQAKTSDDDQSRVVNTERLVNGIRVRVYQLKERVEGKLPGLLFYHGGGYSFGTLDSYNTLIEKVVEQQKLVAISVDYRLAPEYPFPTPTDDCYSVTKYVFDHADEFSIDADRIILSGDSAGGNIAAVMTQKLQKDGRKQAKLQVLIYPWLQMASLDLPSSQLYDKIGPIHSMGFSYVNLVRWYLNITASLEDVAAAIKNHEHIKILKDPTFKAKYLKYLDTSLISSEYISQDEEQHYRNYAEHVKQALDSAPSPKGKILEDKQVRESLLKVLDPEVSPSLADDATLAKLPKAHFAISEVDDLKDEALIYAERLRKAGVSVNVKYHRTAFHGIIGGLEPPFEFKIAHDMLREIQDFISDNI